MKMRIAGVLCTLLLLGPVVSQGEVWNLAEDFSIAQNPNGAWSYGWRTVPEEPLVLYTEHEYRCGAPQELECWNHYIQDYCPCVVRNPQDYPVHCDNMAFASHKAMIHPGPDQQCVVRWSAPMNLDLAIAASFKVLDTGSSTVHVYHNGTILFEAMLDQFGQTADYAATISVQAGDVIECGIDPISFYYDAVQLGFVLDDNGSTAVCPSTWGRIVASSYSCPPPGS